MLLPVFTLSQPGDSGGDDDDQCNWSNEATLGWLVISLGVCDHRLMTGNCLVYHKI